jgi:hypothetical protein
MAYQINTLDKNIISQIWRLGGTCKVSDLAHAAPEFNEYTLRLYVRNLAKKSKIFNCLDLITGDLPGIDSEVQMDTGWYASWRA